MSGPDTLLLASFAPTSADALTLAVRQFDFQHFTRYAMTAQYCQRHGQQCSYDVYIDTHNFDQLVANLEGRASANIWVYHTIEVCQSTLSITQGYGGYGAPYAGEERALLRWLAQTPDLELHAWQVLAGGEGYASSECASGTAMSELLAYLAA